MNDETNYTIRFIATLLFILGLIYIIFCASSANAQEVDINVPTEEQTVFKNFYHQSIFEVDSFSDGILFGYTTCILHHNNIVYLFFLETCSIVNLQDTIYIEGTSNYSNELGWIVFVENYIVNPSTTGLTLN